MNREFTRAMRHAMHSYLVPLARRLKCFWSWWLGELATLVPESVLTTLVRHDRYLCIEVDATHFHLTTNGGDHLQVSRSFSESDGEALPGNIMADVADIRLVLPGEIILCKRIDVPIAAEENLLESVSFQLDRLTPFSSADVYFDCLINHRDPSSQTLAIDLVLSPRESIDPLLCDLKKFGVIPHRAFVTDSEGNIVPADHLLPADKKRNKIVSPLWRRRQVLTSVCAVLAIVAIAIPIMQKGNAIALLEPQVQTAIQEARAGAELRQRVEQLSRATQFLRESKRTRILALETIDEISRRLPNHTWINRLDLSGDEVQIQGQSAAAASLIQLLEQSPMLTNVRFRSPVTGVGDTGDERFHLSANVVRVDPK